MFKGLLINFCFAKLRKLNTGYYALNGFYCVRLHYSKKMFQAIKLKIDLLTTRNGPRSQKILKNIFMSFGVKAGGIVVSLMLVPMTMDYISPTQYGIWLTISSIVSWMNFFDVGLGNGLRNKLSIAIAQENVEDAKIYVSTTYASLSLIAILLLAIFWTVNPYLDWNKYLNIPYDIHDNISNIILVVLASFCLQFVVQIINTVLTATHESAVAALVSFLGQLGILVAVFILKKTVIGSLAILVWALTLIPVLVYIIASVYLYNSKLGYLSPSFKKIQYKYARSLINTGGMFFVIQIGAMLLFQTNNIIITNILGPQAVTEYNVSYKMFSIVTMIFTIIITPYWSAFTDAYVKLDFDWMAKTLSTIRKVWFFLSISALLLLVISKWLLNLWVGSKVGFDLALSISMTIYTIAVMWQTLHVYILNGVGKIKLQLVLVILGSLVNIPFGIYLCRTYGLAGIVFANTVVFIFIGILCSVQVKKILDERATGIWSK